MARSTLLTIPAALPLAFAAALAQGPPRSGPPAAPLADYALTNVRIVTAPGRVIERGTVLTRDGRIAAVGAQVTVPAGVVQMDLGGHTVFPGLIDAATSIGLPSPTREVPTADDAAPEGGGRGGRGGGGRGGPPGGGAPVAGGRASAPPPPVVMPEVDANAEAADMFSPTPEQLKAFRDGGITTVGLVFQGGLFPGRVGAALTGMREGDSRLALRTTAGQQVAFGTRRGGYPGTGIGSVAFIRQSFLDAQHEARLDKAMRAGTPGARPSNDPFSRALMPAADNQIAAWFVASTERQMIRVAEIAKELGLRTPVVVGAQEGWRIIPTLKGTTASAVVSLNWPTPESVTGRSFVQVGSGRGGPGSEAAVAAADSAAARDIRANAGALARAGVPVALASFGGESGTTFRDRIRMTIAAGMSPDDALRAATVTPAALLGVSSAVGTIEVGKLANLVVVSGNDLFASTPIKHVFVEGRLY